jgi:hypothetical protein
VFTDPFTVTYNSTAYTLPRTGVSKQESFYRTADGVLMLNIRNSEGRDGSRLSVIKLARRVPDPTPTDVFDPYREIINGFSLGYQFDSTLASSSDIPLLRTALLSLVDSTLQGRLLGGEK